jgi:caffeoyl-CoA O-methyltransferase
MTPIEISEVTAYAEQYTTPESSLLRRINRETHAEVKMPRMLSGHLQGRFLAMISTMIRPKQILEVGTYTGYSALCLAEGLGPEGKLITIDNNDELEGRVRGYFAESKWKDQIDFRIGNASMVIPGLPGPFDIVWIDADKENYGRYYDLAFDKVSSGGYLLADNVLWSGKVLEQGGDKDTRALQEFNRKVRNDSRIQCMLLPLRDGVMMMRKN